MLVVLVSEVKTHPSRTAVIYTTLIKNALILDTQKAIPIYIFAKYTARQRQLTHSAPLHQGGIMKLKESYRVKTSILQNASTEAIIGNWLREKKTVTSFTAFS